MGRRRPSVTDEIYARHLYGDALRYAGFNAGNRTAIIQRMYMRILTELATNRFKWMGLPSSINPRFLEINLFFRALSVFYYDHDYGKFMSLRGGPAGPHNMYDDPIWFFVTGNQFQGKRLCAMPQQIKTKGEDGEDVISSVEAECVPIWANFMRIPDLDIVTIYAQKLAELDVTIEINSKNARRPKVIVSTENTKLSLNEINRQIDAGEPVIQLASQSALDSISGFDLGVTPDTIEKLHILKARLWNECMTLLGIDNSNQDKKERLVAAEVDANDDQISSTRAVNLNARKQAARDINKRYGLAISVDYQSDIDKQLTTVNDTISVTADEEDSEVAE